MKFSIEQLAPVITHVAMLGLEQAIADQGIPESEIPLELVLARVPLDEAIKAVATHPRRSLVISYGACIVLPVSKFLFDPRSVAAIQLVVQALEIDNPARRTLLLTRAENLAQEALTSAEYTVAMRKRMSKVTDRDPQVPAALAVLYAVQGKPDKAYEQVQLTLPANRGGTGADEHALKEYNAFVTEQLRKAANLANQYA